MRYINLRLLTYLLTYSDFLLVILLVIHSNYGPISYHSDSA